MDVGTFASELFIYAIMITKISNGMNGARTLNIHQDGAAPGLYCPTSTTGGQPLIAYSSNWNAQGANAKPLQ